MNIGQVSILMPAYNAEKTILRAVNSLLEQSYENVVNLLETEAANYAEDTGIMTVTVAI